MGMTKAESEAYLADVQSGNVLVFATGTPEQADAAVSVMNSFEPIEVEEFAGSAPKVPAATLGETGTGNISTKIEDSRATSEGARVFSW